MVAFLTSGDVAAVAGIARTRTSDRATNKLTEDAHMVDVFFEVYRTSDPKAPLRAFYSPCRSRFKILMCSCPAQHPGYCCFRDLAEGARAPLGNETWLCWQLQGEHLRMSDGFNTTKPCNRASMRASLGTLLPNRSRKIAVE